MKNYLLIVILFLSLNLEAQNKSVVSKLQITKLKNAEVLATDAKGNVVRGELPKTTISDLCKETYFSKPPEMLAVPCYGRLIHSLKQGDVYLTSIEYSLYKPISGSEANKLLQGEIDDYELRLRPKSESLTIVANDQAEVIVNQALPGSKDIVIDKKFYEIDFRGEISSNSVYITFKTKVQITDKTVPCAFLSRLYDAKLSLCDKILSHDENIDRLKNSNSLLVYSIQNKVNRVEMVEVVDLINTKVKTVNNVIPDENGNVSITEGMLLKIPSTNGKDYGYRLQGVENYAIGANSINMSSRTYDMQLPTGEYSTVSGGIGNFGGGLNSVIAGGRSNITKAGGCTIAGGNENNSQKEYSSIGGGVRNTAKGRFSTISGGKENIVYSEFCTIGGGKGNSSSGTASTVSGGEDNSAAQFYCTVGGGKDNYASANYSTIPGGLGLRADNYSQLSVGTYNTKSNPAGHGDEYNFSTGNRLFNVGNGTDDTHRSDALIIYANGKIVAPSLDKAEVDTEKSLTTKEYVDGEVEKAKKIQPLVEGNVFIGIKKHIDIPDGVTEIKEWSLAGSDITSITIPNSVTKIGEKAFSKNKIRTVSISNSIMEISAYAFYYNLLTSVAVPEGVLTISKHAFSNNQLETISIPNSVTEIGEKAFIHNKLISVALPPNCHYKADSFDSNVTITGGIKDN